MQLRVLDDGRPGYAILEFDSPLEAPVLSISIRSALQHDSFLGPGGQWQRTPYFFLAQRIEDDAETARYRVGPEIVNHMMEFDRVAVATEDGAVHAEGEWRDAVPEIAAGPSPSMYRTPQQQGPTAPSVQRANPQVVAPPQRDTTPPPDAPKPPPVPSPESPASEPSISLKEAEPSPSPPESPASEQPSGLTEPEPPPAPPPASPASEQPSGLKEAGPPPPRLPPPPRRRRRMRRVAAIVAGTIAGLVVAAIALDHLANGRCGKGYALASDVQYCVEHYAYLLGRAGEILVNRRRQTSRHRQNANVSVCELKPASRQNSKHYGFTTFE